MQAPRHAAILIVEDEQLLRDAFILMLKAQDYQVDAVANGQEALERCQETTYDLILLDLMMPILDGIGFLERADLAHTAPHTRILVLSNFASGNHLERAKALGAHNLQVKASLSPRDIIALVEAELRQ